MANNKYIMRVLSIMACSLLLVCCSADRGDKGIERTLTEQLGTSFPGVIITVDDGVVTLSGTCPDASCKNATETAARNVSGVKSVTNDIVVSAPAPPQVQR